MVLIFKTLVDLWRERLAHLDALLAKHPYDSWRLRAEHKVLEYLVRRYENDVPSWPLGPRRRAAQPATLEFGNRTAAAGRPKKLRCADATGT